MHRLKTFLLAVAAAAGALAAAGSAMAGGAVYTLTNAAPNNAVAVFDRVRDGTLTPDGTVFTGGAGTAAGLGSQGAVFLEGHRLFAVNAGSNTVSLLRAQGDDLGLRDIELSGGVRPISVTAHDHLVYVLNNGDASTPANIAGFWLRHDRLYPLPGSIRPLSSAQPGPAQISFSPDGRQLVVTEKATQRIVTYQVGPFGYASGPQWTQAVAPTPFGFAFDKQNRLFVSEANGGAPNPSFVSSYALAAGGAVTAIDPAVPTTEIAACWVAVTENGRYVYAANATSASISGFAIGTDGDLSLLDADGRTANTGAGANDLALAKGSHFLYALAGGDREIDAFRVNGDGSLTPLGATGGLPAGTVGLAAS
jgi:6-phosphogluconolactonase